MLKWDDILRLVDQGNPAPERKVIKTPEEWQSLLSNEQYQVTRQKGTEHPFSSDMCSLFEAGLYACVCCDTLLFDANEKFESGSGWPSFTQPLQEKTIAYHSDTSHGMRRIETTCNTCDAHLGHVFPDGPEPSGLRYCMNAVALKKTEKILEKALEKATFGGGCFWCTEALFQSLRGVESVTSGYCGGTIENPSYREVCTGKTGHAEVIQVIFNPAEIDYANLLRVHFATHDPTSLNQQGADKGTQYRSVIFPHSTEQKAIATQVIAEIQPHFTQPIVTSLETAQTFFSAEEYHQNYYQNNKTVAYCEMVISPKLAKLKHLFTDRLKQ